MHIVGVPTILVWLIVDQIFQDDHSFGGFTYVAALYMITCQNLYQVRMLYHYCEKFNDKILSKAMSSHFVFSVVAFKVLTCIAACLHNYKGSRIYLGFSFAQLAISCNFAFYYIKMNKLALQSELPR